MVGGELGLEAGTALLTWMGLGFLAVAIGQGMSELMGVLRSAIRHAWHAAEHHHPQFEINRAAQELARAVSILIRLILQGILAYVLKKGAVNSSRAAVSTGQAIIKGGTRAAADETLAEVSALLRKSKLPDGFVVWIEKNWDGLKRNPKLASNNMASIGNSRSAPAAATPSQLKTSGNQRTADLTRATPAEQSPVARPVSKSVEQDKTLLDRQGVPIGARQGLAKPGPTR